MSYTPIELDKVRNLKYEYEDLSLAEETLDMSINEILNKAQRGKMRIKEIFTLLWAGLVHEDNQLTVKKLMQIVKEYSDIDSVSFKIGEALAKSFGSREDDKNEKNE
ncbi:MAG TPA: hypothetical protein PKK61_02715 [Defluviitaleaceae bacterium]|nr:hypothetical protein [Defluviitaleaceae bacterium]